MRGWDEVNIGIPRLSIKMELGSLKSYHLHVFTDVAQKAYAPLVYLQAMGSCCQTSLIFVKTRLGPPKAITVPESYLTQPYKLPKMPPFPRK